MPNGVSPVIVPGLSLQSRLFIGLFQSALACYCILSSNNVELGLLLTINALFIQWRD